VLWPAQYRFPPAEPFTGDEWYNPYAGFSGKTLKACTHTHSRAWSGLTHGTATEDQIYDHYRENGYDVACITNYLGITPPPSHGEGLYLPAYEHTMSITKQHQTVLGARRVSWFDYPLWQETRHKQEVIDLLAKDSEILIINHPNHFQAYTLEDFDRLTGYDGIEVMSRFAQNLGYWDRALSAGRLVFGVTADDGHDLEVPTQYCRYYIDVEAEPNPESFYEAFRAGRFYASAYRVPQRGDVNALVSCEIVDGELRVEMRDMAHVWRFIGQGGKVIREFQRQKSASLPLAGLPGYVRVEIYTGGLLQYLNPVIRFDGEHLPRPKAEFRPGRTGITRGIAVLLFLYAGWWLFLGRRRPV
jgi:hypothetical protein